MHMVERHQEACGLFIFCARGSKRLPAVFLGTAMYINPPPARASLIGSVSSIRGFIEVEHTRYIFILKQLRENSNVTTWPWYCSTVYGMTRDFLTIAAYCAAIYIRKSIYKYFIYMYICIHFVRCRVVVWHSSPGGRRTLTVGR